MNFIFVQSEIVNSRRGKFIFYIAQYEIGMLVSRWELTPGDLVFFRTYNAGASHVGIYIGDGRFIHASDSRGVVISSIEEFYYRDRFLGGRRM